MRDKWLPVLGYETLYEVNSFGEVRHCARTGPRSSHAPGKVLKGCVDSTGYYAVMLYSGAPSTGKWRRVHLIVAEAFFGARSEGQVTNHRDGNKLNNRLENLEYCTHAENMAHAGRTGLMPDQKGERNGNAKLTAQDVEQIRQMVLEHGANITAVGRLYGVSRETVRGIIKFQYWKDLAKEGVGAR